MKKDKQRIKSNGEVFTPKHLIDRMLNKINADIWTDSTKTFCDPAAGDGNIIISILEKRLQSSIDKHDAIKTLYAVELMKDNVEIIKQRCRHVLGGTNEFDSIMNENFICHDSLTWCWWGETSGCGCELCKKYGKKK